MSRDLFRLVFGGDKSDCLSCQATRKKGVSQVSGYHVVYLLLVLVVCGFLLLGVLSSRPPESRSVIGELLLIVMFIDAVMLCVAIPLWFARSVVGTCTLVYYDSMKGDLHWHRRTRASIRELSIASDTNLLQLRSGGWFRRCRVLDRSGAIMTNWQVTCWHDGDKILLTDIRGNAYRADDVVEALAIVNTFSSVRNIFRHWEKERDDRLRLQREFKGAKAQQDRLLAALVEAIDTELHRPSGTKSPAAARFREAVTKAIGDWLHTEYIILPVEILSTSSTRFVEEWRRITARPSSHDCCHETHCDEH